MKSKQDTTIAMPNKIQRLFHGDRSKKCSDAAE
jgi:hypothetical protein